MTLHRFMEKVKKDPVEQLDEEIVTKQKKEKNMYLNVLEYFLLVTMIGTSFYFVSWLWAICLGSVLICLQIMKVVTWLTIREKIECDICHKKLIGERNEEN